MHTQTRKSLSTSAPFASLLIFAGCMPVTADGGSYLEDKAVQCGYEVDFDPTDPNDYLWTVEVADSATRTVLGGYAEVHFRRFAAGVNLADGEPVQSGQILSRTEFENPGIGGTISRLYEGTYWSAMTLAQEISYQDLINGSFQFYAVRNTDQFALPSCVKSISFERAVGAHNQLLDRPEGPTFPTGNITDPQVFFDQLKAEPGIVMLVDAAVTGDRCDTPATENTSERRSVLSHLAVKITAKPNPQLIDPNVQEGVSAIDFDLGPGEGNFCQSSPHDWHWEVRAFNAQVKVGNQSHLPAVATEGGENTRDVKLEVFSGSQSWVGAAISDGLAATNIQVDPDDDINPTRGDIVLEFAGKVGGSLEFNELTGGAESEGITFRLRRDDWVSDLSYAECTVKLRVDDVRAAFASSFGESQHRIRVVPQGRASAPNEVEVSGCTDGWFADQGLGLVYFDLGVEAYDQDNTYRRPDRPDISDVPAGRMVPRGPEVAGVVDGSL